MPAPNRNGYYTGQMFTNEVGERYVWMGSEWSTAGNDNYTPVSAAKEINITFNTFLEEGGNNIQAKVLVNDAEWADSSSQNGKITIKFFEYQILNPTKISFISTNAKAKKTFIIQTKVNQDNEVLIKDADEYGNIIDEFPVSTPIGVRRRRELIEPDTEVNDTRRRLFAENPDGGSGFVNTTGGQFDGSGGGGFGGGGGGMREVNPLDFRGAGYGLADVTQRENIQ